ncbi:hypothetical protein, partial [Aequorivita antarctica]|uniref:hypothetical protein n=1 Tax=Aequorivita antarctica TaxID=153266 RepID=UPI001F3C3D95
TLNHFNIYILQIIDNYLTGLIQIKNFKYTFLDIPVVYQIVNYSILFSKIQIVVQLKYSITKMETVTTTLN